MSLAAEPLRWLAFLSLGVLPGAWIGFGMGPRGSELAVRWIASVALSPVVLTAQFYALRFAGLDFDATTFAVVLLNLAAVPLVRRSISDVEVPGRSTILVGVAALILPVAYLATWMFRTQFRANYGHSWTHTAVAYLVANGQLRPEEPLLAGTRLAYPWLANIPYALSANVLGSAPNANYLASNAIVLLATFGAVATLVHRLGGGRTAKAVAVVLLSFGANFFGYLVFRLAPGDLMERYPVWGDFRFTPWLIKFGVFEPTVVGIGLCSAILVVASTRWTDSTRRLAFASLGTGLVGLAFLYPLLFPVGCLVVASRICVVWFLSGRQQPRGSKWTEIGGLTICGVVAAVLGYQYLDLVTADRAAGAGVGLAILWKMKMKSVAAVLTLAPHLAGLALMGPKLIRKGELTSAVLALSGLGCLALFVVLDIYGGSNEYKFIFPAAVALTPFAAIGIERLADMWPRGGRACLIVGAVLLADVAFEARRTSRPGSSGGPTLDVSHFRLRLADSERLSEVTDAVRSKAPVDGVVVSRETQFDLAALTSRAGYAPYSTDYLHGIGIATAYLLEQSRGYASADIAERQAALHALYDFESLDRAAAALDHIAEVGRPLVIIVDREADRALAAWITESRNGRRLVDRGAFDALLIDFDAAPIAQ